MICDTTWPGNPAKTYYPKCVDGKATLIPGCPQTPRMGGMHTEAPMDAYVMALSLCKIFRLLARATAWESVHLCGPSTDLLAYMFWQAKELADRSRDQFTNNGSDPGRL